MRKIAALGILITFFLVLADLSLAAPSLETATLNTAGTTRTLLLPPAADNSPAISLGTAIDPATGKQVEGWAIIHRRDNLARPGGNKPGASACYSYLAKGAKWRTVEPWVANLNNTRSLDPTNLFHLLSGGVNKWEDATDGVVSDGLGRDVLGPGVATTEILAADTVSPDNQNEVYFADISEPGAIAVTVVWGIFGGPIAGRQLVEWDQVYDDVTFDWAADAAGVAGKMDFDNVATHELGHSLGLADLYNTCVEETMYGYSTTAETKKRDLNTGDIAGANALY